MQQLIISRTVWLLVLWLGLSGCVPAVPSEGSRLLEFTFSAEAWGGLPFPVEAKQQLMMQALRDKQVRRLEQPVTYLLVEVDPRGAVLDVVYYQAFFEIDARGPFPVVIGGYRLGLRLASTSAVVRMRLTNQTTGITRSLRLDPTRLP